MCSVPCWFFLVCESFSHVRLFATSWTVAGQAPLSMEFSRQEYWSGFPFPSPGVLSYPWLNAGGPQEFLVRLTLKSVDSEEVRLLSVLCAGLIQLVESLNKRRLFSPRTERSHGNRWLLELSCNFPRSLACYPSCRF